MFKQELKRSLLNRNMLLGLIIGMIFVFSYYYQFVMPLESGRIDEWYCINSAYNYWIGASCSPMQSYIFFYILPILAVLPAGLSLYEDYKSGYYRQILIRGVKKKYYISKIVSVFISGGVVITIPLIVSFYLSALRLPLALPEGVSFAINRDSVLFDMYYNHPMIYFLFFIAIDFMAAGAVAVLAMFVTFFVDYRFVILIFPFTVYYFVSCIDRIFGNNDYSPNYFLISGFPVKYWWEYALYFGIAGLVVIVTYIKGMCYGKEY